MQTPHRNAPNQPESLNPEPYFSLVLPAIHTLYGQKYRNTWLSHPKQSLSKPRALIPLCCYYNLISSGKAFQYILKYGFSDLCSYNSISEAGGEVRWEGLMYSHYSSAVSVLKWFCVVEVSSLTLFHCNVQTLALDTGSLSCCKTGFRDCITIALKGI